MAIKSVVFHVEVEIEIAKIYIEHPHIKPEESLNNTFHSNLLWNTRSAKANIIELITALYETGEIQTINGNPIQIKDFIRAFEVMFNTSLHNYYKHKHLLVNRKRRTTPFLDRLARAFTTYCENL